MTESVVCRPGLGRRLLFSRAGFTAITALIVLGTAIRPFHAQTAADKVPPAQSLPMPEWQKAAGGKMEFEVASVRQSALDAPRRGYVDLLPFDGPPPASGLFSANLQLLNYMLFAYKIVDTSQTRQLMGQLPKWAETTQFNIEARSEVTPTRDQLRNLCTGA